ncbi:unnamed protein product [Closterium sp. NIES-65]|nr:unnamed protein product [Closterium sp. NIES-65]
MAAPQARLLLLHFLFLSAFLTFFNGPSQADLLKADRDPLHSVPAAVDTDTPRPSDGVATSTASAPPPAPSARAAAPSAKPSSAWERAVAALKPAMYGAVAAMSVGAESDVPTDALRPLLAPDVVVTAKVRLLNAANLTSSGIAWQGLTCPSDGTLKPPSPTAALLYLRFEQRADSQNSATPLTSRTWPFADSAQPSPVYAAPLAFLSPIVSFRLYPGTPVGPAAQQKELSLVGLGGSVLGAGYMQVSFNVSRALLAQPRACTLINIEGGIDQQTMSLSSAADIAGCIRLSTFNSSYFFVLTEPVDIQDQLEAATRP